MDIMGILARDIRYYSDLAEAHRQDFGRAAPGSADKETHRQRFVLAVQVFEALSRYRSALQGSAPDGDQLPALAVVLEGGLVSAVVTRDAKFVGMPVHVIDYDVEGADWQECAMVEQTPGKPESESLAVVRIETVEAATIGAVRDATAEDWEFA